MEQLKTFIEKAKTDSGLMAKLDELGSQKAVDDEYIALAAEHGFTFTKEDFEQLKADDFTPKSCQLCEEELENISGGEHDRYNPEICSQYKDVHYHCVGFFSSFWCKYYERTELPKQGGLGYRHKCKKEYFDYNGWANGTRR